MVILVLKIDNFLCIFSTKSIITRKSKIWNMIFHLIQHCGHLSWKLDHFWYPQLGKISRYLARMTYFDLNQIQPRKKKLYPVSVTIYSRKNEPDSERQSWTASYNSALWFIIATASNSALFFHLKWNRVHVIFTCIYITILRVFV